MTAIARHLCVILLLALLAPPVASAEIIPPGEYRGVYHRDRWNQGRFRCLFVAPELHERLHKTAGRHCEIDVTKMYQPMNPGGAMVMEVGKIRYLPQPVELRIEFADARRPATLRTLRRGQPLKLRVTLTNRSDQPLLIHEGNLFIRMSFHYPSQAGTSDPMGFWSFRDSMLQWSTGKSFTACDERGNLLPVNQTLDAQALRVALPNRDKPRLPALEQGELRRWTTTITNIPSNEFEIAVEYRLYKKAERKRFAIHSNKLRLNVLATEPPPNEGLAVTLQPIEGRRDSMRVVFTNENDEPLRFALFEVDGKWDCGRSLLCYDAEGSRLPIDPLKGNRKVARKTLQPGQQLALPVAVPNGTAIARCVFRHSLVLRREQEGIKVLSTGYVLSPHLVLDTGARPDAAADVTPAGSSTNTSSSSGHERKAASAERPLLGVAALAALCSLLFAALFREVR